MYMRTASLNKMFPLLSPKFRILLFKLLLINLKKGGYVRTEDEIHRSIGGEEPPRKSLVSKEEILDYLKNYDIDQAWLAEKSDQILYTYFLDIWFKEGSQRYFKENMGNLKVKYSDTIGKE